MRNIRKPAAVSRPARFIETLESRAYFSVDLTGSITVAPTATPTKPGGHAAFIVTIANSGTTTATGTLGTTLSVSTSPDGSSPISLGSVKKHIHLNAGGQISFHVTEKIPAGFSPATYYAVADIDAANTFSETATDNNLAVSTNTLTVASLYRDIVGTYEGTGIIKKGFDKGLTFTQTIENTSEDLVTGIVQFTGTSFFPDGTAVEFAGTTTLRPNGSYTVVGADVPADSTGTIHDVAKLIGNTAKGKFANALNSGTFSGTFVVTG